MPHCYWTGLHTKRSSANFFTNALFPPPLKRTDDFTCNPPTIKPPRLGMNSLTWDIAGQSGRVERDVSTNLLKCRCGIRTTPANYSHVWIGRQGPVSRHTFPLTHRASRRGKEQLPIHIVRWYVKRGRTGGFKHSINST